MNDFGSAGNASCNEIRRAIEGRLDGVGASSEANVIDPHVITCEACREYEVNLRALGERLRALPVFSLPEQTVASILWRSIEEERYAWRSKARRVCIGVLAVAAAVALAVGLPILRVGPGEAVSTADLDHAKAQTVYVLNITADALQRIGRTTVLEVLERSLPPVLERFQLKWWRLSQLRMRRLET